MKEQKSKPENIKENYLQKLKLIKSGKFIEIKKINELL